jgi:heme/copper-type cytochrome/quinol oxidase subunit 2
MVGRLWPASFRAAKPMTTKMKFGLFALVFFSGAAAKFAQLYTGRFSIEGFLIGIVLGAVMTGCFWWWSARATKQDLDEATRRGNRLIMQIWAVGFLFVLPFVLGFAFPS